MISWGGRGLRKIHANGHRTIGATMSAMVAIRIRRYFPQSLESAQGLYIQFYSLYEF